MPDACCISHWIHHTCMFAPSRHKKKKKKKKKYVYRPCLFASYGRLLEGNIHFYFLWPHVCRLAQLALPPLVIKLDRWAGIFWGFELSRKLSAVQTRAGNFSGQCSRKLIFQKIWNQGCESSDFNLILDYLLITKPHFQTFNAVWMPFQAFQIISDFFSQMFFWHWLFLINNMLSSYAVAFFSYVFSNSSMYMLQVVYTGL